MKRPKIVAKALLVVVLGVMALASPRPGAAESSSIGQTLCWEGSVGGDECDHIVTALVCDVMCPRWQVSSCYGAGEISCWIGFN